MTKSAFENMIAVNSAIGGSTNAPIHFNAIAKHLGVKLNNDDWERVGYDVPLIVNMQPAGEYLGEDFHHAGGVPAVVSRLIKSGAINKTALTVNGKTLYQNCQKAKVLDAAVIWPAKKPMKDQAGFLHMKGNLFDSAIMKTSVISDAFRAKYLSNPEDLNAFEGRAIVFEGPEDYHKRIDDRKLKIDDTCMLLCSRRLV
jgi:dihydroxy-acid dehydratase